MLLILTSEHATSGRLDEDNRMSKACYGLQTGTKALQLPTCPYVLIEKGLEVFLNPC